jgi:hypothetical protein
MSFIDKAKEGTSNVTSYFLGIILIFVVYILGSYLLILDLQWNFGIESFDSISQNEIVRILACRAFSICSIVACFPHKICS